MMLCREGLAQFGFPTYYAICVKAIATKTMHANHLDRTCERRVESNGHIQVGARDDLVATDSGIPSLRRQTANMVRMELQFRRNAELQVRHGFRAPSGAIP